MPILFLVIFVVMGGFAMLLPSIMYVLENFGATEALATPVLASYSFAQFLAGPVWGRLSDKYGRKPVLLTSLTLAIMAYAFLALEADSVPHVFIGLAWAGACAGNSAVLYATVADLTDTENRAKGMGIIGAGIGLAFTVGPAVGAILGGASAESANITGPAFAAMVGLAIGLLVVALRFRETLDPAHAEASKQEHVGRIAAVIRVSRYPALIQMALMLFAFTVAVSMMEPIMAYLIRDRYDWGPRDMGKLFTYVGLVLVLVQGGLVGRLAKRFGERLLVRAGLMFMAGGLACILLTPVPEGIFVGLTLTSVGSAIFNTSIFSLASHRATARERGLVMGVFQSFQALGRSAGPTITGLIYGVAHGLPFMAGIAVMVILFAWSVSVYRRLDSATPQVEAGA